jgi:hypothetical protein
MAPPGSELHRNIMRSAAMRQTGVSLRTLVETGRCQLLEDGKDTAADARQRMLIQVASFLHRELPIRLAHR